jgi:hypothetical protein
MRNRRRTRLLRRLALTVAVALVAVPVAQAYPDEGGSQTTFRQGIDDFPGSSYIPPKAAIVRGDVKDGIDTAIFLAELDAKTQEYVAGAAPTPAQVALDAKTREYVAGAAPVVAEPIQVAGTSDGFDWGDAGIGAGAVFAVTLIGAGALLATRQVGRPASA